MGVVMAGRMGRSGVEAREWRVCGFRVRGRRSSGSESRW